MRKRQAGRLVEIVVGTLALRVSLRNLLAASALAALFAVAPVHLGKWDVSFGWNAALADEGSGNSGSGSGSGGSDDGNDEPDDADQDEDNSGSGGGGDDDPEDPDDENNNGGNSGPGGASSASSNSGENGSNWFLLHDGTRVEISNGGRGIKLLYSNGWREEIRGGRYVLRDEENRLVVDRAVTEDDYARLQGLLAV